MLKLQRQTQVAVVGYGLIFISVAAIALTTKAPYRGNAMANLLAMLITIPIALYVINCTVVGGCQIYAWIHAYLALGVGVLFGLMTTFFLVYKDAPGQVKK